MTARRVVRATLAAAATAVLAAASSCSGGAPPNLPGPSSRSTLVWYVGSTDQDQEDYARILADEFEESYPPIKVEVRHTPKNTDQSRETLIQALRPGAQNPPDVYLGDVIASRQSAFLRGWNVTYSRLVAPDNSLRAKVGVAPLPSFAGHPGPGYSTVGGWGLYINPHTSHLDEAKEFLRWMTDVQAQLQLTRLSHIPTNVVVRGSDTARTNPAVATGLHAVQVHRQVNRPSRTPRYPAISKAVYENLNAALGGSLSLETALRRAEEEINQALR